MGSEAEPTRGELLLLLSAKDATITQQSELIERLVAQVEGLIAQNKGLAGQVEALTLQVAALERQRGKNSSNSSKPPSSDSPFGKPAPKRSSRTSSGRRRGKQDGAPGETLKLVDDPDETFTHDPQACHGCGGSLHLGQALQGLIDFAVVQSYLSTVGKWGLYKLDALEQLFTTGAWLPPPSPPAELKPKNRRTSCAIPCH